MKKQSQDLKAYAASRAAIETPAYLLEQARQTVASLEALAANPPPGGRCQYSQCCLEGSLTAARKRLAGLVEKEATSLFPASRRNEDED